MWSQSSSAKVWMSFCSPSLQQQLELPAQQGRAYCAGCGNLPSPWIGKRELI